MSKLAINNVVETKDDNIYYNISIVNNQLTDQAASFTQQLTNSILSDPADYYMAVARFSIDGVQLPLFIWRDNYYYVSLSFNGTTMTTPLLFPPDNPAFSYGRAIYSYNEFLSTINAGYLLCMNNLIAATGGGASPIFGVQPPYWLYDIPTGIMSLYAQQSNYDEILPLATRINIWSNWTLFEMFGNMYISFQGQGRIDKLDIRYKINNYYGSNLGPADNIPTGLIKISQEGSNNSRMWDQQTIVFKTSRLGVRPEFTQGANQTTDLSSNSSAGSGIPFDTIMTDFIPTFNSSEQVGWRQQLVHTPQFYRLIDLLGNQSNIIDLAIFWRDQQGVERPFFITSGTSATVKLAFLKKSLYKNTKISDIR